MTATYGSLFTGYGGLDLALHRVFGPADVKAKWHADIKPGACKVLDHHWPEVPNLGDVTKISWGPQHRVDMVTAGFPCTDVSMAGARSGLIRYGDNSTRSGLWSETARAISNVKPALVVLENVRGLLSAKADSYLEPCPWCVGDDADNVLRALGAVLGDLADLGFNAEWGGFRAADVGSCHARWRVFIIAWPAAGDPRTGELRTAALAAARAAGGLTPVGTLLPTPRQTDHGALTQHNSPSGGPMLPQIINDLLPTPSVSLAERGAGSLESRDGHAVSTADAVRALLPTPRESDGTHGSPNQRNSDGTKQLSGTVLDLLPTPTAHDAKSSAPSQLLRDSQMLSELVYTLPPDAELLPTPSVSDSSGSHKHRSGDRSHELLLPGVALDLSGREGWVTTDGKDYGPAVHRWAAVTGNPIPPPTAFGVKGNVKLNPAFVEWMMGLPPGHITGVPGLTQAERLSLGGDGVVPQQAAAAICALLARM